MMSPFFRFLATGSVAAAINLVSRYFLNRYMTFGEAVIVAYLIGMVAAFVLARTFVFESSGRSPSEELLRFSIVNVGALLIVWFVSISLARHVFLRLGFAYHPDDFAHFIGVLASSVPTFIAHRSFTFADQ